MTTRAMIVCLVFVFTSQASRGAPPTTAPARQDDTPILDRIVPELRLENVPLEDAIQTIRESTRSNIVLRWEGLANAGVQKTARIRMHLWDIPVREAIAVLIASAADGRAAIDYSPEGTVLVVSSTTFDATTYDVKVYDVRDLLDIAITRRADAEKIAGNSPTPKPVEEIEQEAAQQLIDLITETVDRKMWSTHDGDGALHIWAGRLFVSQSSPVQKHVEDLLAKIRKTGH